MRPPSTIRVGLFRLLSAAISGGIGLPGCATVGLSEARNEDVPLERGRQEVPREKGAVARVSQTGTTLIVAVTRVCDVRETRTVRRTARRDRVNSNPTVDWVFGGMGLVAIGAGTGIYLDASNVHPRDDTSRQYNPVGPDSARVLGGALVVTGAALASVAVVDIVRTSGEEQETNVVELPGEIVDRGVPCKSRPLVGVEVALRLDEDTRVPIGRTDEVGRLTVKLDESLEETALSGANARVVVGGRRAGDISLAPLRLALEEAAWKGLYKEGCTNPQSLDACNAVEDFLRRYPDGKHAQEARLLLGEAAPQLQRRRDAEAWKGVDPDACAKPKELSSVEQACASVRKYLDDFPNGEHAETARAALKKGEPLVEKQRKKAEREAARQRAAEEALHALWLKGQEAEARKQEAKERAAKQCPARCASVCGGYGKDPCFKSCNRIECEIGGNSCTRRCATKCKGYGDTRCVGRCVYHECNIDPRE